MSHDAFFYCAPCRIKVLVVPLGQVRASYFSQCLQSLHQNRVIPLKDLDQQQLSKAMFTPSAFLQGQLLFEYITDWEPCYSYLEDFQHWRKLYAIIAVEGTDSFSEEARWKELEFLKNKCKTTLVQRILPPDSTHRDVKSFVLEFSTRLLLAISEMAQAIQALPTLRSPMDPSSSVAAETTPESQQELKRPASVGPGGLQRTLSSSSIKHANRNSITASQNASSENLVEKRGASKGRGRVLKVLGDLSLLCGIVPGAITSYIQSVEILRLTTDYIWHASALEGVGMALVLLTYLKVEYSIPSILQSQISAIQTYVEPGKTSVRTDNQATNDLSTDPFPNQSLLDVLPDTHSQILSLYQRSIGPSSVDPVPPICFPDNIIRLARLLCDVYATGDLDDPVLQANVLGVPVDSRQSTPSMYPPRGEIARWAMRAWGPHLSHDSVPMSYRIQIIAALAHIMGTIGFLRKRAMLLNEMLHLVIPQLVQARVVGASESGLHPNAAQSLLHQTADDDGLVSLMDSFIKVYGVGVPLDNRQTSGWPSLRTHILRECIDFCDALPHPAGMARFTSLLFTVAADGIEKDEQIRLAGNLPRIVGASKKGSKMIEVDYWDMFVVQNIEILKATESELQLSTTKFGHGGDGNGHGPFLYIARTTEKVSQKKKIWLVQREDVDVSVTLRNNFDFDLEIVSFSLWTEGAAIDMPPSTFILPAQSLYTHTVVFTPLESGQFRIKGCIIKFSACKSHEFSVLAEKNRREKEIWYDNRGGEIKVKQVGLGFPKASVGKEGSSLQLNGVEQDNFWLESVVDATVLPPQPVLVLDSSSSEDSSMMLLEGEKTLVNLRFRNLSDSDANHLNLTFFDSTTAVLEDALNSTTLAEDEAVELEFFLYERPAFFWLPKEYSDSIISPNQVEDVHIQVTGKRGLTRGVINLEYAFIDPGSQDVCLYCRQVEFHLAITVNASMELLACDFMPLALDIQGSENVQVDTPNIWDADRFLLVLEMRNSWINPLTLTLSVTEVNKSPRTISHLLQSGQTRRIVVDLPRILFPATKKETPLPRKNRDRQFVVSSSTTKDSVATAREAWWYRQHILDCISGTWAEQGVGCRKGDVEMRGIRLNERHIGIVKRDLVEATARIGSVKESLDQSVCRRLIVDIQNHQEAPLTCCLRVIAVPKEASYEAPKSICCEGLDQSPSLTIEPHNCTLWSTEITLLAHGYTGVGVIVEEISKAGVGSQRRWTSNICLVEVTD